MNRKFQIILSASAVASTLAFVPCALAQGSASPDTTNSIAIKDRMTDAAISSKATAALNQDKDISRMANAIQVQTTGGVVTLNDGSRATLVRDPDVGGFIELLEPTSRGR